MIIERNSKYHFHLLKVDVVSNSVALTMPLGWEDAAPSSRPLLSRTSGGKERVLLLKAGLWKIIPT